MCDLMPLQLRTADVLPTLWQNVLDHVVLPGRRNATWNNYYDDLVDLMQRKIQGTHTWQGRKANWRTAHGALRVVEVGTMYGGASERILQRLPAVELFIVDPFLGGVLGETKESAAKGGTALSPSVYPLLRSWGLTTTTLSEAWAHGIAHDFRSRFGCRAHIFHNFSLSAAPLFDDGSIDVAFIDGLHTYKALTADLHAWWPKVADDGVIILNDYGTKRHPDVARAAKAFFNPLGAHICVGAKGRPPGHRNAWVAKGPTCGASAHK